ncbi:amino acid adenylation domain-containing protein [Streptomyces sp. E11-3]|uniref:amino acid adenylation domain-containing protein n=1 Tax=Streptomyces sp. E11-3 TaxID=3110112 RepID=UPI00397FE96B
MREAESDRTTATGTPVTGAQTGIWLAQQIEPDSSVYHLAYSLELRGDTDLDRLAAAVRQAVEEADCLHVRISPDGGGARQTRTPFAVDVPLVDLRGEPDPHVAAAAWMEADRTRPVDLADGPLFGQALLRLGPDRVLWYQRYHHIVLDGTGVALISRRVAEIYTAGDGGAPARPDWALSRLVASDLLYRTSEQPHTDRAYWLDRLADRPEPVRLVERSAAPMTRRERRTVNLSPRQTTRLRVAARGTGTRLSRVLVAAVAAYLHRVTGERDLVIGLPVTARLDADSRDVPGVVSNVLPLRVAVHGDMTATALVAAVDQEIAGAVEHGRYRAEDLARDLGLVDGVPELVGPTVNILPRPKGLRFDDHQGDLHPLWLGPVSDLAVTFSEPRDGEALRIDFDADADACDPQTLADHERRFLLLLDAMAAGMDRPLARIELVNAAEQTLLVEEFGTAPREVPELSWPAAFEQRVRRAPDAVALVCEGQELSYAELNAAANRLARLLIARGVRREDVVAVAVPRSPELVVSLLAVMKAGAAYLPLDADHPQDRIAYMLSDAGAKAVVTTGELAAELPRIPGVERVLLDEDTTAAELASADAWDPDVPVVLDQAAYVIYTSGSTGRPKGVVVTHDGVGSLIATATDRIGIDAESRVVQFASVGFDVTVWDLIMSLCVGGRVILVPAERRVAGPELTEYIEEHQATHMILPPSLVAALPQDCELPDGAVLVVGTEAVPGELIARWSGRLRVVVAYGLTEATVNSTLWPAGSDWQGPVPIGRPDPNTRCYVLDAALGPVGVGVEGELYVAGRGLARGYLGRPGLTSERFVADPFGGPGARMYRTGDRVRWRADGNLEFLGRADGQLKIRGHRIEPGEIESAFMACPGIAQAAVLVRDDHRGARRLVAYLVGDDGTDTAAAVAAARATVADTLPDHMAPSAVVVLPAPLPLTPNGKLDTRALPEPQWTSTAGDAPPTTPEETVLAGLFADVLGLPVVGVHDSFFELGGDSIVAIQLVNRARAAGLTLTPREVFRRRTVTALASVATTDEHAAVPDLTALDETALPVSPLQEGFYFHARFDEAAADLYLVQELLDLDGPVDADRLRDALQTLLDRHPLLRASFRQLPDGNVVQRLADDVTLPWREVDLSETSLAELLRADRAERFDLARPPLLRATLIRDGQRNRLLLTLHHIIADGWSVTVLLRELLATYRGVELPPPPPPHPYLAWLADRDRDAARGAWQEALSGLPGPTRLLEPTCDGPSPVRPEHIDVRLPEGLTADLSAYARTHGLTLSTVLHGVWGLLVGGLTGGSDVVFGTTVSGRTTEVDGLDAAVGLFINTVPARVRMRPDDSLTELLRRVQDEHAGLIDHQHLGLADIQRLTGGGELFDTLVVFENYPSETLPAEPSTDAPHLTGVEVFDAVHYPLALIVHPGQQLTLRFKHDAARLDQLAVATLASRFEALLWTVVTEPERRLAQIDLLSAREHEHLGALNATAHAVPDTTLASLFAAQVARTPQAAAVVFEDTTLSYAELDQRASSLARRLRAGGAGPERFVAVAVPRSGELMVALLAVLKSGAAYLPVDPDYPADRMAFMLADSGARTVVTTAEVAGQLPDVPGLERLVLEDLEGTGDVDVDTEAGAGWGAAPDHPAYLIYTSGSTGRPKGVVVTHRAIVNRLAWMQGRYGLDPDDRVLQKTPSSFDVSVWEFFWPLVEGATVVLARPDGHRDPAYLAELIRAERITTLHFVPSMLAAFVQAMEVAGGGTGGTGGTDWAASLRRVFARAGRAGRTGRRACVASSPAARRSPAMRPGAGGS